MVKNRAAQPPIFRTHSQTKMEKIGRRPPPAAQNPKCPQCHPDAEKQAYGRSWVAQADPDAPDRRQTHFSHSPGKKS